MGKSAFFLTEEFAFQNVFRYCRTVDMDIGKGSSCTQRVNGTGGKVLAGTGLAGDQNGDVGSADHLNGIIEFLHGGLEPTKCWNVSSFRIRC